MVIEKEVRFLKIAFISLISLLIMGAAFVCRAGEITLAWDPGTEGTLNGYYLYYQRGSSIIDDATNATIVDIPLTMDGFDSEQPTYTVTDLEDDVIYYFTVTAYNTYRESNFSNEISGMSNASDSSSANAGSGGGGGCFIHKISIIHP